MDWSMPHMNGDEVIRLIRRNAALAHQPKIVMITAYGHDEVLPLARKAGADAFLVKPASPSALLDTTLSVLGRERLLGSDDKPTPVSLVESPAHFELAGLRLLLVEDNDINREFATELLLSEDIEVDIAIHGQEALDKVQQRAYDMVLMDVQMPVMDGLEATRQIRALAQDEGRQRLADLPIIAMTAQAMDRDVQESLSAGMNDHVTKPVDPEHLLATLAKWVRVAPRGEWAPDGHGEVVAAQLPADLLAMTSINARNGIHRIGDKPDAYRRQLKRFRRHFGDAAQQMRRLLGADELEPAEQYCHSLKGVVGNIGAEALFAVVSEMNTSLKLGQSPQPQALQELARLLEAVLADIDSLADADDAAPAPLDAPRQDDAQIGVQLTQLARAMKSDMGQVEAMLADLRVAMAGLPGEPALERIAQCVDVFDIDAAQAHIEDLMTHLNGAN
jgi:CheY-like chemotaxis protein/HPt (histidine-containing phosphotransfer) domain-containing protein